MQIPFLACYKSAVPRIDVSVYVSIPGNQRAAHCKSLAHVACMARKTKGKLPIDHFAYHDPRKERVICMHQSTEVAGTGENLTQGSWYAMMNEGGIAGSALPW